MRKNLQQLQQLYHQPLKEVSFDPNIPTSERVQGAIMGALIGDALGLGCHWIYDYDDLWRDYGDWVDGYTDPKAVNEGGPFEMISAYRYAAGVRAGMNSQSGQLLQLLLETVAKNAQKDGKQGHFVESEYVADVNNFFENILLPEAAFETDIDIYNAHKGVKLEKGTFVGADGGIKCFSGRYTNEEVRFNFDYWYNHGKKNGRWWKPESRVTLTSTSEGAQWGVVLAALYRDPEELFYKAWDFLNMWYCDQAFITTQLMYIMTVQAIINNVSLEQYQNYTIALFDKMDVVNKYINSFDDTGTFRDVLNIVRHDSLFNLADQRFAPLFFGRNCHATGLIRGAYYLALENTNDFETGILTTVNSGGNNMARAALVGGVLGAMVGVKGIPQRFINGLINEARFIPEGFASQGEYLLHLSKVVADRNNGEIPPLTLSDGSDCGCFISLD